MRFDDVMGRYQEGRLMCEEEIGGHKKSGQEIGGHNTEIKSNRGTQYLKSGDTIPIQIGVLTPSCCYNATTTCIMACGVLGSQWDTKTKITGIKGPLAHCGEWRKAKPFVDEGGILSSAARVGLPHPCGLRRSGARIKRPLTEPGGLFSLTHIRQKKRPQMGAFVLAERVGFEPTVDLRLRLISSQVHSTTLPPLRHPGRGKAQKLAHDALSRKPFLSGQILPLCWLWPKCWHAENSPPWPPEHWHPPWAGLPSSGRKR